MMRQVTADRIKQMREETGLGLLDCRKILEREERLRELHDIETDIRRKPAGDWTDLLRVIEVLKEMNR